MNQIVDTDVTHRDSGINVAIDELQKISKVPEDSQKDIDQVLGMLSEARHADNRHRA